MTFLLRLVPTMRCPDKIVVDATLELFLDRLVEFLLIAFHRQNKVAFAVNNFFSDRFLTTHRIDGDDRTLYVDSIEKL